MQPTGTDTVTDNHHGGPRILRAITNRAAAPDPSSATFSPVSPDGIPDMVLVVIAAAGFIAAGLAISELSSRLAVLAAAGTETK